MFWEFSTEKALRLVPGTEQLLKTTEKSGVFIFILFSCTSAQAGPETRAIKEIFVEWNERTSCRHSLCVCLAILTSTQGNQNQSPQDLGVGGESNLYHSLKRHSDVGSELS